MKSFLDKKRTPVINGSTNWIVPFLITIFLIVTSLFPVAAHAAQVTLTWDASTSPGIAGYKLYYGTQSRNYGNVVNAGNQSTSTITNLQEGQTYYFAATAYDAAGQESDYSNEVSYGTPGSSCSYTISPTSQSIPASGGQGTVSVTTQTGCVWQASSGVSWITLSSTANRTGTGSVGFTAAANTGLAARSAGLTIAGKVFTISQATSRSYTITATAGTGGSISPSGGVSVSSGSTRGFTITPRSGYAVSNVLVDGRSVGAVTSYTFSNVTANHTIAASFKAGTTSSYTLTIRKAGTGTGTVVTNPSGTTFPAGTFVSLTATAASNSTFKGWSGACSGTTVCQGTMTGPVSVTATFDLKSYIITASAGTGGSISPSGNVSVSPGGSRTFYITPASGYRIYYLLVNGTSVSARSSYTFSNVTRNHSIRAVFGR